MRALSLLGIAARAEGIRLKREAGLQARRGMMATGATLFALAAIFLLHVAAWLWLERRSDGVQATLLLAAADLVVMAVLVMFARHRTADPVAEEAQALRQRSLAALAKPATLFDTLKLLPWQVPMWRLGGLVLNRITRSRGAR